MAASPLYDERAARQREGERERAIQVYKTDTAREEEEGRERLINQ